MPRMPGRLPSIAQTFSNASRLSRLRASIVARVWKHPVRPADENIQTMRNAGDRHAADIDRKLWRVALQSGVHVPKGDWNSARVAENVR
jgi:hypothetical protein